MAVPLGEPCHPVHSNPALSSPPSQAFLRRRQTLIRRRVLGRDAGDGSVLRRDGVDQVETIARIRWRIADAQGLHDVLQLAVLPADEDVPRTRVALYGRSDTGSVIAVNLFIHLEAKVLGKWCDCV